MSKEIQPEELFNKNKMREIKETCYKGTRILLGNKKREFVDKMIHILKEKGYTEVQIPIIQHQEIFAGKVGKENNNMMYNFKDRGDRELCLAPEYTAVVQKLAKTTFKQEKDIKLFYIAECFRGEKPQAGRYRQFTQLGIEILNPSIDYKEQLIELALNLTKIMCSDEIEVNRYAKRGLDYYNHGEGFEISCNNLGGSKQICGGGAYEGGIGFAIGIDRLLK